MKEALLEILVCPLCQCDDLTLVVHTRDVQEIREGELICGSCQARIPIQKGVVRAFLDPAPQVIDEATGWVELLDVPAKQHEFKDEWILALPFIRPEQTTEPDSVRVWHQVGKNFCENLDRFDWRGKRVLEIGAGRCWGVAELARRGAYAVGLDILAHKYLGLETADIWFAADDLYFERVLGDMHKMPFRPGAFDFVVTSSSLHHTDRLELALREAARVLDARGHAFFINEPVVPDGQPKPDLSDSPEVLHGIIESRPTYSEWVAAFEAAGLYVEDVWFRDDMHVLLRKSALAMQSLKKSRRQLLVELRFRMGCSRVKSWIRDRIRRAPSAPRYYWQLLRCFAGQLCRPLLDRIELAKITIDREFIFDGRITDDPATRRTVVVAAQSSSPWYVLRGPCIRLSPGVYEAVFRIGLLSEAAPEVPVAELQVTTLEGRRMHGYQVVHRAQFGAVGEYSSFPVLFLCEDSSLEFEFRVKALCRVEFSVEAAPRLNRNRVQSLGHAVHRMKKRVMAKVREPFSSADLESQGQDSGLLDKSLGTQSQDFYGERYYRATNPRIDGGYGDLNNLRYMQRILAGIVMEHLAPQRVLDIGCSLGFAVEAFRERGVEAYGTDFSEYAIAHAVESVKPYVEIGNVLDIGYPDQSFEVVLCSEVLEHLPVEYVDQAIGELCRVTSDKLVLSMPSIGYNEFGPPNGLCFPSVGEVDIVPLDKLDLDKDGRPWGGHVTVASFKWWTNKLAEHGLVRLGGLERKMNVAQLSHQLSVWNFYCCSKTREYVRNLC